MKLYSHKNLIHTAFENHNTIDLIHNIYPYTHIAKASKLINRNNNSRMNNINYSNIYNNEINDYDYNIHYNRIFEKSHINIDYLHNKYNNINISQSINHPVINLELEFNLLKEKINELNTTKLKNIGYININKNLYFQKNINKTDNNFGVFQTKKFYNNIQKEENPIKNSINNYLFINNKFKYNELNRNNCKSRNRRKYIKNEKLRINLKNFI